MTLKLIFESILAEGEYQKGQMVWVKGPASGLSKTKYLPAKITSYFDSKYFGRSTGSSDSLYMSLQMLDGKKVDIYQKDRDKFEISKNDPTPPKVQKPKTKYFGEKDLERILRGIRSDAKSDGYDVDDYGIASDLVDNLLHDDQLVTYVANAIRRRSGQKNVKWSDVKEYILNRL